MNTIILQNHLQQLPYGIQKMVKVKLDSSSIKITVADLLRILLDHGMANHSYSIGKKVYWWSTTIDKNENGNIDNVFVRCLDYYYEYLEKTSLPRWTGKSIRCLHDW